MKVLHVTQSGGGVAKALESIIRYTPDFEHYVIAPKETLTSTELPNVGVKPISLFMTRSINPFVDLYSLIKLWGYLRRNKFDVIHLHSSKAGAIGRLAAVLASRACGRIIYSPHGWSFHRHMPQFQYKLFLQIEKYLAKFTDTIVCVSCSEQDEAMSAGLVPRGSIVTIYNGIEVGMYRGRGQQTSEQLRSQYALPVNAYIYAVNARLAEQKASMDVLEGFRYLCESHPDSFLLFIGDGPLRRQVEAKIADYGLEDKVRVTGWVHDVRPYLWCADIGVLISKWEAFGLAAVEYLAAGLPCLASREGALPELLNAKTAVFVNGFDRQDIADGMISIRDTHFSKQTLVDRASQFSVEKMGRLYDELYKTSTWNADNSRTVFTNSAEEVQ